VPVPCGDNADGAFAATEPLGLSFQFRGESIVPTHADKTTLAHAAKLRTERGLRRLP
jgi:hypothetical protein